MAAKKIYSRAWLNPKEGSAVIESTGLVYDSDIADGSVKITDCNHTINLDFTFHDKRTKEASKKKLEMLLTQLALFKGKLFG